MPASQGDRARESSSWSRPPGEGLMDRASRILVVEDSDTQALKLQLMLENEGCEVVCAATAERAIEELNQSVPDLVIVDYHLPGVRGDEVCRRIRMNMSTRGIAILMLTAEETDAAELHGLESGADDYISKSVDDDILMLRVRGLLRKSSSETSLLFGLESALSSARLLAVDDSATYLEFLTEELRSEGYRVDTAISGAKALEMFSSGTLRRGAAGSGDAGHGRHRSVPAHRRSPAGSGYARGHPDVDRAREQGRHDARAGGRRGRLRRQVERPGRAEGARPGACCGANSSRKKTSASRASSRPRSSKPCMRGQKRKRLKHAPRWPKS